MSVHGRPVRREWHPKRIACGDLWHFMIILTNGKVLPCCRDYLYQFELGNLRDTSLAEVWYGKGYQHLRNLHIQKRWGELELCNDCDTWMCRTKKRKIAWVEGNVRVTKGPFFRTYELDMRNIDHVPMDWKRGIKRLFKILQNK